MYIMFSLIRITFAQDFLRFTLKLLAWSSCGLGLGLGTCSLVNIPGGMLDMVDACATHCPCHHCCTNPVPAESYNAVLPENCDFFKIKSTRIVLFVLVILSK